MAEELGSTPRSCCSGGFGDFDWFVGFPGASPPQYYSYVCVSMCFFLR